MRKLSLQYILLISFALGCGTKTGNAILDGEKDSGTGIIDGHLDSSPNGLEQCPTGRWCWQEPLPTGDHYVGIWAASDSDIWAVTKNGTVVHYNGSQFELKYQAQEKTTKASIWGQDKNHVWIQLGFDGRWGRILYWNGSKIIDRDWNGDMPTLMGGVPNKFVWTFSQTGYYNRLSQTTDNSGSIPGLTYKDSGQISMLQYSDEKIVSMQAFSDSDVWVMSTLGNLFHWDGSNWTNTKEIAPLQSDEFVQANGVWGSAPDDIWAVYELWAKPFMLMGSHLKKVYFRHFDGKSWSVQYEATSVRCGSGNPETFATKITGKSSQSVRVISTNCETSWEWNGTQWQEYKNFNQTETADFANAIASTTASYWYAGMFGRLGKINGENKIPVTQATPQTTLISASMPERDNLWTISGVNDILAESSQVIRHWNGTTWLTLPPIGPQHRPYRVLALSATDVWVGGNDFSTITNPGDLENGFLAHWNGNEWSKTTFTRKPGAFPLWASSSNDVWAQGRSDLIRWNGRSWVPFQLPSPYNNSSSLYSVSGVNANDVWIGGSYTSSGLGFLLHWDGQKFVDHTSNIKAINSNVQSINVTVYTIASNDVWVVTSGYVSALLRWNGTEWTKLSTPQFSSYMVWGTSSNDVWLAGNVPDGNGSTAWARNAILHWNGSVLRQEQNSPSTGVIHNIFGSGPDDVWIATQGGLLRTAKPK